MSLAVKDLIDAGVHFGHRASRWNPKMKPYIYSKRNLIHIIDLKETVRGLLRAAKYFNQIAANNGLILFVGTKRQAADIIVEECQRGGMPYVTERWLGGTLTNFRTIRSRLERLSELESILDSEQALSYSKKMVSMLTRERRKIQRNLEGIRHMTRLPEAIFVIDPQRERIAVREARKLDIKVVALMDTDCDPDLVDLPIPGNDDSMRSIELVVRRLMDAIIEGRASAPVEPTRSEGEPSGGRERQRGDRRGGGRGAQQQPGAGAGRGMAARVAGSPAPTPAAEPSPAAAQAPEGEEAAPQQQADSPTPGAEPSKAGIKAEPAPIEPEIPTIAPAAVETARPGSEGKTDIPPSAAAESPETTPEPEQTQPAQREEGQASSEPPAAT